MILLSTEQFNKKKLDQEIKIASNGIRFRKNKEKVEESDLMAKDERFVDNISSQTSRVGVEKKKILNPFEDPMMFGNEDILKMDSQVATTPFLDEIINDFKKPNFNKDAKNTTKGDPFQGFSNNSKLSNNPFDDFGNTTSQKQTVKFEKNPFENFV